MKVQYEKGELMEVDCSCDTTFMLRTIDEVGKVYEKFSSELVLLTHVTYFWITQGGGGGVQEKICNKAVY